MNTRHARRRAAQMSARRSRRRSITASARKADTNWPKSEHLELITEICPGYNLGKAYKRVSRAFEVEFKSNELTLPQFAMMVNIGRSEPSTGTEVAERLGSDLSTVSRTIESLVTRGYVAQTRGEDRRVRIYSLTDDGRRVLRSAIPLWEKAKRSVLSTVDTRAWEGALRVLKRLAS